MAKKDEQIPIQVTGTKREGDHYVVSFDNHPDVTVSAADALARARTEGSDTVEWPLLGQMAKEQVGRE